MSRFLVLLCLSLSVIMGPNLSRAAQSTSAASAEHQLRIRLQHEPRTFDWNLAQTATETPISANIMEGLFEISSDFKLTPRLAQSYTVSADGKTYTFKLRPGVMWSDGKPLIAEDFVYSWQRLLNPVTASLYAHFLSDIEGAPDFISQKNKDASKLGIKALDPKTLQVTLRKPVPYFLQLLTYRATFPIRRDVVEKYGVSWTKPENIVVLGPYIPVSTVQDTRIVLKRNPRYYGPKPAADSIVFYVIGEDSTALNLFKAGQLDFVWPLNYLELGEMAKSPAFKKQPFLRSCFIGMNINKFPLNFPGIRRAISMAIDKSQIPKATHLDLLPADSLVPHSILPEGADTSPKFNPAEARRLLAAQGLNPETLGKIELLAWGSDLNALLAQFIQNELKKNLGLNIDIQMTDYKVFRTRIELGAGAMNLRCWSADYVDPNTFLAEFTSTGVNNLTGWKSDEFDRLVEKASSLTAKADRAKTFKEALELLQTKDAAIVPLYFDVITYLLNPKVKGLHLSPLNYPTYRDVTFEK